MSYKFIHDDQEFEIRHAAFPHGYEAAVFHNGDKLCENVKMSFEGDYDAKVYTGERGLQFLIRGLESEVRQGQIKPR